MVSFCLHVLLRIPQLLTAFAQLTSFLKQFFRLRYGHKHHLRTKHMISIARIKNSIWIWYGQFNSRISPKNMKRWIRTFPWKTFTLHKFEWLVYGERTVPRMIGSKEIRRNIPVNTKMSIIHWDELPKSYTSCQNFLIPKTLLKHQLLISLGKSFKKFSLLLSISKLNKNLNTIK